MSKIKGNLKRNYLKEREKSTKVEVGKIIKLLSKIEDKPKS